MVVAGEESGDMHAAKIVAGLRAREPGVVCWGIGGEHLRRAGMEILVPAAEMAVMGLTEVLRRYGFFKQVFTRMVREAAARKPDVVLLVDYPGFNLRLAERLHQQGFQVVYYICPQVWAWKRSRIGKMARILDRLMVIFPFETQVFAHTSLRVHFVGHPLVEEARQVRTAPPVNLPWKGTEHIALLPGSRRHEICRILPVMLETAALLQGNNPERSFIIAAPSEEARELAATLLGQCQAPLQVEIVVGKTRQVLRQARGSLVASGTATIEAALQHCPMIIVYKTAALTYALARLLVRGVKHIGMVNIVAGHLLCPEFIQHKARADEMAAATETILRDGPEREKMIAGLTGLEKALDHAAAREDPVSILLEYKKGAQPTGRAPNSAAAGS